MKAGRRVSALQRAWLEEVGVDTHWLCVPESGSRAAAAVPAPQADTAAPTKPVLPAAPASRAEPASRTGLGRRVAPLASAEPAPQAPGVSSCGPAAPYYLIVGAQPGIADEAVGHPFQGDSGLLLRAMLAAARLPRADAAHFTTLLKHRAPGGREPTADEVAAALPALQQEILTLRPRWILALGAVAAGALLDSPDDFATLRGGPHTWSGPDGLRIPLWVTFHPSSLLVRASDKPEAWRDLVGLARAVVAAEPDAGS